MEIVHILVPDATNTHITTEEASRNPEYDYRNGVLHEAAGTSRPETYRIASEEEISAGLMTWMFPDIGLTEKYRRVDPKYRFYAISHGSTKRDVEGFHTQYAAEKWVQDQRNDIVESDYAGDVDKYRNDPHAQDWTLETADQALLEYPESVISCDEIGSTTGLILDISEDDCRIATRLLAALKKMWPQYKYEVREEWDDTGTESVVIAGALANLEIISDPTRYMQCCVYCHTRCNSISTNGEEADRYSFHLQEGNDKFDVEVRDNYRAETIAEWVNAHRDLLTSTDSEHFYRTDEIYGGGNRNDRGSYRVYRVADPDFYTESVISHSVARVEVKTQYNPGIEEIII